MITTRKEIKEIQFGILSPTLVRRNSVLPVSKISSTDVKGGYEGDPNDSKLGASENSCETCKYNRPTCPGHFGHLELSEPVYNTFFIKHVASLIFLRCDKCKSMIIDNDQIKELSKIEDIKKRRKEITSISERLKFKKPCFSCGYRAKDEKGMRYVIRAEDNYKIIKRYILCEMIDIKIV